MPLLKLKRPGISRIFMYTSFLNLFLMFLIKNFYQLFIILQKLIKKEFSICCAESRLRVSIDFFGTMVDEKLEQRQEF